ncbi:MAG: cytosine deaminase [Pseudomonadota bacterium]
MDFARLPPERPLRLTGLRAPACLLDGGSEARDGLAPLELTLGADGRLAPPETAPAAEIDLGGSIVFPAFVDAHAHLDKGHIWARTPNPDGTFQGALSSVGADRAAYWSESDVRTRAEFALKCAFSHGTRAIRTHLDSIAPQQDVSWPLFSALREAWKGRIELQMVSLNGIEAVENTPEWTALADLVARHSGVLGTVTYPVDDLERRLTLFFETAGARGLEVDFHSDETLDPASETLRAIAEAVIRTGFDGPVAAGHCCSLSTQDEKRALETLDLVAEAGLSMISLPLCNLYLQDRRAGRTPRHRGVTLVHEAAERGIPVAFASDNTRDPFYAYGDLDMLEVMREATRIAHLDHSRDDWPRAFASAPAAICGFEAPSLAPGAPADLVICRARGWTELLSRPQGDRIVIRGGRAIDRTAPEYRELDAVVGAP